jgi:hypothetical protein
MDSDNLKAYVLIGAVVVVLLGVGWFFWSRGAPPAPTPGPNQTIQNPFGGPAPTGQAAAAGAPGAGQPAVTPAGGQPGYGAAAPRTPAVPAPGTRDPRIGFGPSAGGPFRKQNR